MNLESSVCFSHKEDPDGIISASLIKQAFNSTIHLVDYNNFLEELLKIDKNYQLKELFICDLEIKPNNTDAFLQLMEKMKNRKVSIYFIDHHIIDIEVFNKLNKLNVTVINSNDECTSSLIYKNFKEKLRQNSTFLTACACITDNREDGNECRKIIQKNDKMMCYLNSALIWFYVRENQRYHNKLHEIVQLFFENKYPYELQNVFEITKKHSSIIKNSIVNISNKINNYENFDVLEIFDGKFETNVEKLLMLSEKNLSLVFRKFQKKMIVEIAILSKNTSTKNIGQITNDLCTRLNGFGGGDPKKSAAIIPRQNFDKFLLDLDESLN